MPRTRRSSFLCGCLTFSLALFASAAPLPPASAYAAEPQRHGSELTTAPASAAGATEPGTAIQPADQQPLQAQKFIDTVRQNFESLIATQEKLQKLVGSLNAELAGVKSRVKQYISERDEALRQAEASAETTTRLEAHAKAARDALALEGERNKRFQQKADATIHELRSQLAAMQTERDDLKAQLGNLLGMRHTAPHTLPLTQDATGRKVTETGVKSTPPTQLAQPRGLVAMFDRAEQQPQLNDRARQESKNRIGETPRDFVSRHCVTVLESQDAVTSAESDISVLRSRLESANAAMQSWANDISPHEASQRERDESFDRIQKTVQMKSNKLSQAGVALDELSRGKQALLKNFEGTQKEVDGLSDEQRRIELELKVLMRLQEEATDAFAAIQKRMLELETAAELLSIRQKLDDFKVGRINRPALAQHESMLSTTARKLEIVAREFTTASANRARLSIEAHRLQARITQFTAKIADVDEHAVGLVKQIDSWLQRAGSQQVPPFKDIIAMHAEMKQNAERPTISLSESAVLVERQNESRKNIEANVRAISETLNKLNGSLRKLLPRLNSAEADARNGQAQHPLSGANGAFSRRQASPGGFSSIQQDANENSVAGRHDTNCSASTDLLEEIVDVKQGLEDRLEQISELSELAGGLASELAIKSKLISLAVGNVEEINQKHREKMGHLEGLANRIAHLTQKRRAHEKRLSAESETISELKEQLHALAKSLASTAREARAYAPVLGLAARATESGEAAEIQQRLNTLFDRVGLLTAGVVALKRPPPLPTMQARPSITGAYPDNDHQAVSSPQDVDSSKATCNFALPSCRRWLHLREEQSQRSQNNGPGDEEEGQHN